MRATKTVPTAVADPPAPETLIEPGRVLITPDLARRILVEANYEKQRPIRAHHLSVTKALVTSDSWLDGHQIWFAQLNGRLHLVDGQTRLSAIYETGRARIVQAEIQPCETADEVHRLYCRFDRYGRRRSDAEVLNALEFASGLGLEKKTAMAVFKAAPYLALDFPRFLGSHENVLLDDEQRIDYLENGWVQQVQLFSEILGFADTKLKLRLQIPGITAVALITLRDQRAMATDFWTGVSMDDGLRRGDPRHTLVKTLREEKRKLGGSYLTACMYAATAWNAFYAGKKLDLIRLVGPNLRIAGVRRPA